VAAIAFALQTQCDRRDDRRREDQPYQSDVVFA
jgi:hypothetical protein